MIGKEVIALLKKPPRPPHIVVVGDVMLDHYILGAAKRLSPEAPVPVVNVHKETFTPGGAANVAQNLFMLNAHVTLCSIVGHDAAGQQLLQQLTAEHINTTAVITDATRATTIKTRILAGGHQLLRVDKECTTGITPKIEKQLLRAVEEKISTADFILLSDYNKGLLTHSFTQKIIQLCKSKNKPVAVDPKGLHYEKYTGAYLIKPNKRELAEAVVVEKIDTDEELQQAGKKLLTRTKSKYLVVTRSEEGLTLITKNQFQNFPVKATEVFDVTGAGDTVFASLGYFLALGVDVSTACELANYAAAIAVSRIGSVAVTIAEVMAALPAATQRK